MGVSGQCHTPIALPQNRNPVPIVLEAGWAPRASYTKYFNNNHIHIVKGNYSHPCVHHKVMWWSGGTAPTFLNLSTRRMSVVSSTPQSLYPWECVYSNHFMTEVWVSNTASLDALENRDISCSCCKLNHDFSVVQSVV